MNRRFKKFIARSAFAAEIAICALFFAQGFQQIAAMKSDNSALINEVKGLRAEVDDLQGKLDEWNSDAFYKEQQARESLQMARPDEEIYV